VSFRPLPAYELDTLDDDRLIAYIRSADEANEAAEAKHGLGVLVYGRWANVRRRVALKIPSADVDDLTGDIIAAAFESAFDGESVGQFVNWLNTITQRKVADYHRRGPGHTKTVSIDGGEEGEGGREIEDPGEGDFVETADVIEGVMGALSAPHRRVVELNVLDGHPAGEVAGRVPDMTEANVHQIASRFRRDLRAALEDDDGHRL